MDNDGRRERYDNRYGCECSGPQGQSRRAESGSGSGGCGQADAAGGSPRRTSSGSRKRPTVAPSPGEVGRIVRREGLYSSHLTAWRKARREGSLKGLTPKRRGRKPTRRNPLQKRVDELEAEVARLHKQLATAETILEVQGKVAGLLGLSFDSGKNS